ncbi:MAG: hypothetical protein AAGI48_04530 [Verrucomicrobiota bacterium]
MNRRAGEGRLVFCAIDEGGEPLEPGLTVIFEYGLPARNEADRLDWALAWHELGGIGGFGAGYRDHLARVTRAFTDRPAESLDRRIEPDDRRSPMQRVAALHHHERTQLMRVRINDGACGPVREFREFHPEDEGLMPAELLGTPREAFFSKKFAGNRDLVRWLKAQKKDAMRQADPELRRTPEAFELPVSIRVDGKQEPVTAMVAPVEENDADFHWDGWGLSDYELRRNFSMQTCCGCHCGDTSTVFFHIEPRSEGEPAGLSRFLRTDGSRLRLKDPVNRDGFVSSEMEDRQELFEGFLKTRLNKRELKELLASRRMRVH